MPAPSTTVRRRAKARKALRIAIFCVSLVLGVILALLVLARFAGGWGIPYFSMTTENGSRCVNTFTGFTCESVTLGDVELFGDVDLPDDTQVVRSRYVSTHDYALQAALEVPAAGAQDALTALQESYGKCVKDHPNPLSEDGLTSLCILANDQETTQTGIPDSRVYVVGTALRADGTRVVNLSVRSR
ncbi:hypothetical protein [Microlunatus sagamiharensis]|uniref:hypothetical protein n=1 Tax=Microlunatus sagamiharensis TaxID=546874 RepID=UPI0012FDBB08|nr:hypothetical protein [Microlunatus sagamiharensis]